MMPAPIPPNEALRLQALRACQILDTPREPRFDALARLTARLFGAKLGTVSLIDEQRQWFKASTEAEHFPDIPREKSLCAHTILTPREITVVEDLRLDPRFFDGDLVTGPLQARFYASAPLLDPSGFAVGTICAIDSAPLRPETAAVAAMADLAAAAAAMLQLHRRMAELRQIADHDPLTGLLNRSAFNRILEQRRGESFGLLCFDLDRFKEVNDLYGHAGGDRLLIEFGQRLRTTLRGNDVLARLGGDEFAAVLPGTLSDGELSAIVSRILADLARPVEIAGQSVPILSSIGIARAPIDGTEPATLMHRADLALYGAKRAGRRQFQFYDVSLDQRSGVEDALREAVRLEALTLRSDPIIRLADGAIIGREVRPCWLRPDGTPMATDELTRLADQNGLLSSLDSWRLRAACTAAARWPVGECLVLPLSLSQLRSETLVAQVAAALAASTLPPDQLELTVAESVLMLEPPELEERLRRLRSLGVRLAICDFGAQQAPLQGLIRYPLDGLRLSPALVMLLGEEAKGVSLLRAITSLAKGLSLQTVALGDTTPEQRDQLLALGVVATQSTRFEEPVTSIQAS